MNEPLGEREVLCVSQFTLYGDTRKGNRPAYVDAARPEVAEPLYEHFCARLDAQRGVFGAHMDVELVNDGPVTVMSKSLEPPRRERVVTIRSLPRTDLDRHAVVAARSPRARSAADRSVRRSAARPGSA